MGTIHDELHEERDRAGKAVPPPLDPMSANIVRQWLNRGRATGFKLYADSHHEIVVTEQNVKCALQDLMRQLS